MKVKFIKNLYQIISAAIGYLFVEILFMIFLVIVPKDQPEIMHIYLVSISVMLGLPLISIIFGFYYIFQFVYFDDAGFKICILRHVIREVKWDEVKTVGYSNWMRNPTVSVYLENDIRINFDRRKKIVSIINSHIKK